jgi:hypothetical protein
MHGNIHPETIAPMNEAGVDRAWGADVKADEELGQGAQVLIPTGCDDPCPVALYA